MQRLIRAVDRVSGLKACSVVVAVSEYMKERVMIPWPRTRVVCIPNGIDLARFSPPENGETANGENRGLVVGCAARLIEGKGVDDLVRAISNSSLRGTRLRVAGAGPLQESLKGLARSLGVETRTEFLGAVLDMPAFWRSVDVAVVPSNRWVESFGMVAVEAMGCGRPVVATENGALPSIVVDGKTGRVVPAGDVEALAAAIGEYAHSSVVRMRHGLNGRLRCEEHFGIERAASQYLELCRELVRSSIPVERSEL
jgi:glycosyltransferase involved in cell wall biosynthesis